jgi:hypothetical protein
VKAAELLARDELNRSARLAHSGPVSGQEPRERVHWGRRCRRRARGRRPYRSPRAGNHILPSGNEMAPNGSARIFLFGTERLLHGPHATAELAHLERLFPRIDDPEPRHTDARIEMTGSWPIVRTAV